MTAKKWNLTARPSAAGGTPASGAVRVVDTRAEPISATMGGRGATFGGYSVQLGRGLGGRSQLVNWPAMLEPPGQALRQSRDNVVALSRDLERADPQTRGAVARKADMIVGSGFLYSAQVNRLMLGLSAQQAAILNRALELIWQSWAADPLMRSDRLRIQSVGEILRAMYRRFTVDGEGFGVLRLVEDGALGADWLFQTALQHLDTDRISTPSGRTETLTLRDGVETDDAGAPIAYHIRGAHPQEISLLGGGGANAWTWTRVPRFDERGRPVMLHLFDPDRPGSLRGFGDLVSGLVQASLVNAYREHEVANAAANALFLGIIESNSDPLQLAQDFGGDSAQLNGALDLFTAHRDDYYGQDGMSAGGVRFARLAMGDKVTMATQPRQTDFVAFTSVFERAMASGLGLSQEQYAADFSRTNYSSARASLAEIWRSVPRQRALLQQQVSLVLLAVLDDAVDSGLLQEMVDRVAADRGVPTVSVAGLPEPLAAAHAWTQARWTGPGRGQIDPTKEAEGASMRIAMGVSSLSAEAAELGRDLEDVLAERAADMALAAEYGVPVGPVAPAVSPPNTALDAADRAAQPGAPASQPPAATAPARA